MIMKYLKNKILLTITLFLSFSNVSNSQIKVMNDGRIFMHGLIPAGFAPIQEIHTQQNTSLNGALNIKNFNSWEHALLIRHSTDSDWQMAVCTSVNRAKSIAYDIYVPNFGHPFWVEGDGKIISNGGYVGSDLNLKTEIKPIEQATQKVNSLRGITYKYKADVETEKNSKDFIAEEKIGLFAQDVEKVAPQAVKTVHDGTKAVNYASLVGLLVEAFNERSAEIKELEAKINFLKENNSNTDDQKSSLIIEEVSKSKKALIINKDLLNNDLSTSLLITDMIGRTIKKIDILNLDDTILINSIDTGIGLFNCSLLQDNKEIESIEFFFGESAK